MLFGETYLSNENCSIDLQMAHPVLDMRLDESMPRELILRRHADFLSAYEKNDDCTLDYLKLSGVFWTLTALDLLGELHNIDREAVLNLVVSCQQADGGLSPAPRHDSHLLSTLSGIQILALFGRMDMLNVDGATRFILSLQNRSLTKEVIFRLALGVIKGA
ncbi:prenyltransferase and squalene oxidase repeat-containing domain protein [Opisthorchis viverrini]|uniref:Geranylgeranyl transferase type II subunit beta n=1 Tax=Opisthorchis viverrini TaxID=6198 RepID=A0A1S8WGE7_OPIVI|nr:prenyltransferase and squalene oxidase repeat-containing domain protein [Opisthorchis viverrini]